MLLTVDMISQISYAVCNGSPVVAADIAELRGTDAHAPAFGTPVKWCVQSRAAVDHVRSWVRGAGLNGR